MTKEIKAIPELEVLKVLWARKVSLDSAVLKVKPVSKVPLAPLELKEIKVFLVSVVLVAPLAQSVPKVFPDSLVLLETPVFQV